MKKLILVVFLCHSLLYPLNVWAETTSSTEPDMLIGQPEDDIGTGTEMNEEESEQEIVKTGWVEEEGNWFYYAEGEKVKGWLDLEGERFFLHEETGIRHHGWLTKDEKEYYFSLETGAMFKGRNDVDGKTYYFDVETGEKRQGIIRVDNQWYYFDSTTTTGLKQSGWYLVGDKWYYFDKQTGASPVGWFKEGGQWYYLSPETGIMKTGWAYIGDKWYFLNTKSGKMQIGWLKDGNNWYYLRNSGAMHTGWVYDNHKWYYLNSSGAMRTGWLQEDGNWYYLHYNNGGAMAKGWTKVNNQWYYLHSSGVMKTGWHWEDNKWYFLRQSGAMAKGWFQDGDKWYYAYTSGALAQNKYVEGYYLGYSGVWIPDIVNPRKTYTYEEMVSDIALFEKYYPDLVKTEIIGKSVDGRNIYAFKIGTGTKEILLNGSHHAREHMTTNLLMEMADQYIHSYVNDETLSGYKVRNVLDKTSIWFVPMVNPDGVTLVQKGYTSAKNPAYVLLLNNNSYDFSSWKANIRGVDLNRQYPADWNTIKGNTGKPSPANYKGEAPLTEPEVIALYNFTKAHNFKTAVAYHSAGEILYWYFKQGSNTYTRDYNLAVQYGKLTGYSLVKPVTNPSGGGFTDWFIQEMKQPGFTPEISPYTYGKPVPLSNFDRIWNQNKLAGLMLANEAISR